MLRAVITVFPGCFTALAAYRLLEEEYSPEKRRTTMRVTLAALFFALACIFLPPAQHLKQSVSEKAAATVRPALANQAPPAQAPVQKTEEPVLTQNQRWMKDAGIPESEWPAVDYIVSHESGWCPYKWEGQIGYCPGGYAETYSEESASRGYGLCQSTPAIKMANAADSWRESATTQLKWCNAYAQNRYGGWQQAKDHWTAQIAAVGHGNW
jgi:hypothetical protein